MSIAIVLFGYGVVVGVYHTFPYHALKYALNALELVYSEKDTLAGTRPTAFLTKTAESGTGVTRFEPNQVQPGLTLIAGFFDDNNEIRLLRADGTIVNRWPLLFSEIFQDTSYIHPQKEVPATDWNAEIHGTLALPDGSVVFNFDSKGMVKLDRCGKVVWKLPEMTHHSIAISESGGYWVPGRTYSEEPSINPPIDAPFKDDSILKVSENGQITRKISLLNVLKKNNLMGVLLANGQFEIRIHEEDFFHLNDIEELTEEYAEAFPMFAAGDLLISLRNLNTIMVLNPNSEVVKWHQTGPWIRQHDPDFHKNGTITVFNNNTDGAAGALFGGSNIMQIQLPSARIRVLWGENPHEQMYTRTHGKHQLLANGNMLITDYQGGRVLEVESGGEIVWEYLNRYDKENVAKLTQAIRYPLDYFDVENWSCGSAAQSSEGVH